jgi:ketosteroid isomerase-like protein
VTTSRCFEASTTTSTTASGQYPLGGERHTKQALRLWFQRLFRLYDSPVFEVHRITLTGWPWDLRAAAEWSAVVTPARGDTYRNRGVHIIRIRPRTRHAALRI